MQVYKAPYSELANPKRTKEVLRDHGFYTKHKLGQNFLVQDSVIGKILHAAQPQPGELILEVGPGIGTLSLALLKQGVHLISVEMDTHLPKVLSNTLAEYWDNFNLIQKDALKLSFEDVSELCKSRSYVTSFPQKLVANLPYQIAATLILKYFQEFSELQYMCVMVQSEVADRIVADIRTKNYSAYTVKLSLFAEVVSRFQVPPHSFEPQPRVDSSVIVLKRINLAYPVEHLRYLSEFIDLAFAQRRKTLRNNLKSYCTVQDFEEACIKLNINPASRAEELKTQQFIKMYELLSESQKV